LPGQFFQATMLSMLIGGIVGTLAGLPISIMAVLDGLLAGVMGGMMGTMLAAMIPTEYMDSTIKIITVLCSGIIFVLFLMLQGEIKAEHLTQRSFLLSKPISMFAAIAILLLVTHQTSVAGSVQLEDHSAHSRPSQEESSDCLPPDCNTSIPIKNQLLIRAADFSFNPSSLRIKANEKIRITLDNAGDVEHDFEIVGTDIHVHAGPGLKSVTTATIEKAGTYKAICTLPGHKEAGMISVVQVVL
ncbi:MAG TPA: cupredoxin domain-containing protein, partial [Bacilli bacterium]